MTEAAADQANRTGPAIRSAWAVPAGIFAAALVVLFGVYWSTWISIVDLWAHSATFTHGYLIVPVALWLAWRKRARLATMVPMPDARGLILLLGLTFIWAFAEVAEINAAWQFAWVAMIPALVWTLWGSAILRQLAFPLFYLFFAVPFGEFLIPALQDFTALFTVTSLRLTGIPVLWEGRYFYIPSGSFEVADACSGTRYLIASVALGAMFAHLTYRTWPRRLLFMVAAVVVPILANGLRAYGIVMLAHLSDYQLATGVDHFVYGWVFFGVVIALLFWVGGFFRQEPAPEPVTTLRAPVETPPVPRQLAIMGLAILGLVIAPALLAMDDDTPASPPTSLTLPTGRNGWEGPLETRDTWQPVFPGARTFARAEYRKSGQRVSVYVALFAGRGAQGKMISVTNTLFDPEVGRRISESENLIELPESSSWPVQAMKFTWENSPRLLWQWYEIGGTAATNPLSAKFYETRARLLRDHSGSRVVVLMAEGDVDADGTADVLQDFLAANLSGLRAPAGEGL